MGPIPYSARRRYALEEGLDWSIIRPFIDIIGALDSEYIKWADQEQQKRMKRGAPAEKKRHG